MPERTPDNLSTPVPVIASKTKLSRKWLFLATLLILFSAGVGMYALVRVQPGQNTLMNGDSSSSNANTPVRSETLTDNKVFYNKDNNIFAYDINQKVSKRLTDFPSTARIVSLQVIGDYYIGFGYCSGSSESLCNISIIDIRTEKQQIIKEFGAGTGVSMIGFANTDTYVYTLETPNRFDTYLYEGGSEQIIKVLRFDDALGRGAEFNDASVASFSPDQNHYFVINTYNPANLFDFNIYLYAIDSITPSVIPNATHASWIDNDRLVYASVAGTTSKGLYVYTVSTNESKKIAGVGDSALRPNAINGQLIAYTDYDRNQIYTYSLLTQENKKILDLALNAYWANPNMLAFHSQLDCTIPNNCQYYYNHSSLSIMDLSSGETNVIEKLLPETSRLVFHSATKYGNFNY